MLNTQVDFSTSSTHFKYSHVYSRIYTELEQTLFTRREAFKQWWWEVWVYAEKGRKGKFLKETVSMQKNALLFSQQKKTTFAPFSHVVNGLETSHIYREKNLRMSKPWWKAVHPYFHNVLQYVTRTECRKTSNPLILNSP